MNTSAREIYMIDYYNFSDIENFNYTGHIQKLFISGRITLNSNKTLSKICQNYGIEFDYIKIE